MAVKARIGLIDLVRSLRTGEKKASDIPPAVRKRVERMAIDKSIDTSRSDKPRQRFMVGARQTKTREVGQ